MNIEEINPSRKYGVTTVAELIGYHPQHLRKLIRQGKLRAEHDTNGRVYFKGVQVLKILSEKIH